MEVPLQRINDVRFHQSILDRAVGAGDLIIESAGTQGQEVFADIRQPEIVLAEPGVAELLDFTRPVAVLAVAILPFVTDDVEAAEVVAGYRSACVAGSHLAISHVSQLNVTDVQLAHAYEVMARTPTPVKWRTEAEIRPLIEGYSLVDPGLVWTPLWRPDPGGLPAWLPDPAEANEFYKGLFGWEFENVSPAGEPAYFIARLDGGDVAGIGAAGDDAPTTWNTYIAVENADDATRLIKRVLNVCS